MSKISVASQTNIITALRRSPAPECFWHPRQMQNTNSGAIFMPLAQSFRGLGKNTERTTTQRGSKDVDTLYRWGRKVQVATRRRIDTFVAFGKPNRGDEGKGKRERIIKDYE